ncbi:MAG: hypothetical protein M1815_004518 [Lichina confinis]|nr:MAG: hypothetical protein M1815_004518 [Lichina confinis]
MPSSAIYATVFRISSTCSSFVPPTRSVLESPLIRPSEIRYIVVDLMTGGDLRFHISRKTFTEEAVRFWMAELGCAVRYIHRQNIVHRDIKPDNVLLDADGHAHLADFNVASDLKPDKKLTSRSGTLAYLAPEVYEDKGYGSECDWWSLGVTFFECIYNKRPFTAHGHEKLAALIIKANPRFPVTQPPVSMPCLHAISSLLEKDVTKRIGAIGFESFTQSPFFQSVDFELLERRKIEPVFVPSSEKTNFDATYDLEELLLEEAPLEARARRQRPREQLKDDATDKQIREDELHRMIETCFEPFDYTLLAVNRSPASGEVVTTTVTSSTTTQTCNMANGGRPDSRSRSSGEDANKSPDGSPPLQRSATAATAATDGGRPRQAATLRKQDTAAADASLHGGAASSSSSSAAKSRRIHAGVSRDASRAGGTHVVLNETGSWSELGDPSSTVPPEAKGGEHKGKPNGMLGFLSRKRGRGVSPKPQERGVLGKEGARHIIG